MLGQHQKKVSTMTPSEAQAELDEIDRKFSGRKLVGNLADRHRALKKKARGK